MIGDSGKQQDRDKCEELQKETRDGMEMSIFMEIEIFKN